MTSEGEHIRFLPSWIPKSPNFVVPDSSYFQKWNQLPAPTEVKRRARAQHLAGIYPDPRRANWEPDSDVLPPPVVFGELGLFVKWGSWVQIAEAQCLYAIRRSLKGTVPVPEVYGWCTEGNVKYIYMQYVRGVSLAQVWSSMGHDDKVRICRGLRIILQHLRQVEQDPRDPFVGSITRGLLYDRTFHISRRQQEAGPFITVRDFHEWFMSLPIIWIPYPHVPSVAPFRKDLPDDCAIKFTHGDLHPRNIIVTPSPPFYILVVVDWEQSGWLPEYWEARKAQYAASDGEEWSRIYLPLIMDQFTSTS